jgi:hypothetical protein
MGDEPRNAASVAVEAFLLHWGDRDWVLDEARGWFADGFVREDHRRVIAMPDADVSAYLEQHLVWFEIGDVTPTFEMVETIAVRGERLAAGRMRVRYGPETETEMLYVVQCDEAIRQTERLLIFDDDDVVAAVEALDRLHREIERGADCL